VTTAGSATREGRQAGPRPPRRVVLVSESDGLAVLVNHLLGAGAGLTRFPSLREALDRDGLHDADTVVLDLPRGSSDPAVVQIRHYWPGRLVVLAERGHRSRAAASDPALTLLARPFPVNTLARVLDLPGRDGISVDSSELAPHPPVARAGTAPRPPVASTGMAPTLAGPAAIKAAAGRAPPSTQPATGRTGRVGVAGRAPAVLAHGWRTRRRVRMVGFSAAAVIAFSVAFALASQGGCGPGCDALGSRFSPPAPTPTSNESSVPSTSRPRRPPAPTAAPVAGSPTTVGLQGLPSEGPAITTAERATTTTREQSPGGGGPGPTTPPTRPPTTPPTTSEPTTTETTGPTTTEPSTTAGP
jgi:hypothetical protein